MPVLSGSERLRRMLLTSRFKSVGDTFWRFTKGNMDSLSADSAFAKSPILRLLNILSICLSVGDNELEDFGLKGPRDSVAGDCGIGIFGDLVRRGRVATAEAAAGGLLWPEIEFI